MTSRSPNFHEDLSRSEEVRGSTDRIFGLTFAAFFTFLGLWPFLSGGNVRLPAMGAAAVFLLVAIFFPALLRPLNRLWMKLGLLLGRIVNPIVTAVLFFLVFTPSGLVRRWLGKDPLRLKREPEASTYWITKDPPGPLPETMTKQF